MLSTVSERVVLKSIPLIHKEAMFDLSTAPTRFAVSYLFRPGDHLAVHEAYKGFKVVPLISCNAMF